MTSVAVSAPGAVPHQNPASGEAPNEGSRDRRSVRCASRPLGLAFTRVPGTSLDVQRGSAPCRCRARFPGASARTLKDRKVT